MFYPPLDSTLKLLQADQEPVPQNIHHTVAFGGYILVGLVLVTMLFTAMEEKIAQWFNNVMQMVGLVEDHNEAEEEL